MIIIIISLLSSLKHDISSSSKAQSSCVVAQDRWLWRLWKPRCASLRRARPCEDRAERWATVFSSLIAAADRCAPTKAAAAAETHHVSQFQSLPHAEPARYQEVWSAVLNIRLQNIKLHLSPAVCPDTLQTHVRLFVTVHWHDASTNHSLAVTFTFKPSLVPVEAL